MRRSLGRHNSDPKPTDDQNPITATKIGCELPQPLDDGVSTLQCQRASMPHNQTHANASSKRTPESSIQTAARHICMQQVPLHASSWTCAVRLSRVRHD